MTATPPFDIAQTAPARLGRALGWAASASVVALLLSGLAALAMAAAPSGESLGEDAAITVLLPPPAPPVTALGDPAPDVAAEAPTMAEAPPEVDTAPDLPDAAEAAPDRPDPAEPLSDPIAEAPPDTDATLPPEPAQLAEKMVQPVKEPEKPVGKPAKPPAKENVKPPAAEASAGGAAQPKAPAAKSAGKGKVADADYGASVLSKIRKTKKRKAPARGTAVVGFSSSSSGALATVKIVKSSGSDPLDQVALDHIRRAGPFPQPPEGAQRKFLFEFVSK
jgi:periplasmic protein TonB